MSVLSPVVSGASRPGTSSFLRAGTDCGGEGPGVGIGVRSTVQQHHPGIEQSGGIERGADRRCAISTSVKRLVMNGIFSVPTPCSPVMVRSAMQLR